MDFLENVGSDDRMQVGIHEVKDQIQVTVILSPDHILKSDYILVPIQLLQKYDLSKSSLCVGRILESVEALFECNYLL